MSTISRVAPTGTTDVPAAEAPPAAQPAQPVSRADRFMLRLLRVRQVEQIDMEALAGAHRAFRWAIVFTAIRCTVTYLLVPILVPIVSAAGMVATPLSITLCLLAGVNGVVSLRRFWRTNHRGKWMYTWFMAFVFLILIGTLAYEFIGVLT